MHWRINESCYRMYIILYMHGWLCLCYKVYVVTSYCYEWFIAIVLAILYVAMVRNYGLTDISLLYVICFAGNANYKSKTLVYCVAALLALVFSVAMIIHEASTFYVLPTAINSELLIEYRIDDVTILSNRAYILI